MYRINQLKLPIEHTKKDLLIRAAKILRTSPDSILSLEIKKRSLDARKKPDLNYIYAVDVNVKETCERKLEKKLPPQVQKIKKETAFSISVTGEEHLAFRPVIIGTGPAGLFCAYELSLLGFRPILLERGQDVDHRQKDVETFWNNNELNPESNVQFGEGGAGTFSDGKLNTMVKDPLGRNRRVLETFVKFGASPSILYENKPHIGTDILKTIVKNMREEIISLGGSVYFHTKFVNFFTDLQGTVCKVEAEDTITHEHVFFDTSVLVLAIGHSARDTFELLKDRSVSMQPKSFAVGVRIEHPQTMIDISQYGEKYAGTLPAAAYKLTTQLSNGRGVYTFCMCPGGFVVNASSEEGKITVNGMSYSGRDGENANSAVIVTITPDDFGTKDVLSGMEFQRKLEKAAYVAGKGVIPVQLFSDYCKNIPSQKLGQVKPQNKGNYALANLRPIFPDAIGDSIEEGIKEMGKKIHGFDSDDALLSGVESRTSSPVRILRDSKSLEGSVRGIYPCGEGAGYAGGITSAAMDGIKVAQAIAGKYYP